MTGRRETSETERVRDELLAKQSAVYRGSTVWQGDTDVELYRTVHGTFTNLRYALDAIDAAMPIDTYVGLKLDAGRGGYRPDEVANLIREAVEFGERRGWTKAEEYLAARTGGASCSGS